MVKSPIEYIKIGAKVQLKKNSLEWLEVTEEVRELYEGIEVYAALWDLETTKHLTNDTNSDRETDPQDTGYD